MIAAHDGGDVGARPIDGEVRIRAVAGQVAQADDAVILSAGVGEDRFESLAIGVNIADDQERHRRSSATSGGAPRRAGSPMVPIPRETKMERSPSRYKPST